MLEDKETPQLAQPQYDLRDSQSNTRITRMVCVTHFDGSDLLGSVCLGV